MRLIQLFRATRATRASYLEQNRSLTFDTFLIGWLRKILGVICRLDGGAPWLTHRLGNMWCCLMHKLLRGTIHKFSGRRPEYFFV